MITQWPVSGGGQKAALGRWHAKKAALGPWHAKEDFATRM